MNLTKSVLVTLMLWSIVLTTNANSYFQCTYPIVGIPTIEYKRITETNHDRNLPLRVEFHYPTEFDRKMCNITCLYILNWNRYATIEVIEGGLNYRNVTAVVTSKAGEDVDFTVHTYGTDCVPNPKYKPFP